MPFEHLQFTPRWKLSAQTTYQLGQCRALIDVISRVPIRPKLKGELKQVSLIKGIQATAAIEGNTLSQDEIRRVAQGKRLPPSKAYQEQEVNNILQAMNEVLKSESTVITPHLLQHYHALIGKDLPAPFNATPGVFAQSQRTVGNYRCPPPGKGKKQVEGLVKRLCEWLKTEFGFASGKQKFRDGMIEAIVTHVYIEWIHPFDDGNGRTGRLVEFYLLLRAGVPDICAHILSNYYNETRPKYYAHIGNCQNARDLTPFIAYAVAGFLDGLREVWEVIADELLKRAWRGYVYDKFADIKWSRPTFRRRRRLLLDMPILKSHGIETIPLVSAAVAREYAKLDISAVKRDINALLKHEMLIADAKTKEVSANINTLRAQCPEKLRL